MRSISTKELRLNLPKVRRDLKRGEGFLLIHQSEPIAHILPVDKTVDVSEDVTFEDLERAQIEELDNDWLSEDQITYYMSL